MNVPNKVEDPKEPVVDPEEKKEETPEETPETPEKDEILDSLTDTEGDPKEKSEEKADETDGEEEKKKSDDETPAEGEPKEEKEESKEEPDEEKSKEGEKEEEAKKPLDPKEEARNQYDERQKAIAERKARVKTQTDDYISKGEDDKEQRIRAIEAQEYNRIIDHNEQTLIGEFDRVKANPDLQIFNQDSDQYNEKAYSKAIRDYNAGYLGYDANGNLIEIKGSLYKQLTETADLLKESVKSGQVQQVRDSRKMNTNADPKVAASPKEVEKDPILEILQSD